MELPDPLKSFLFLLAGVGIFVVLCLGCGKAVETSASSGSVSVPAAPPSSNTIEDGVTGGSFSSGDGKFSASIPSGVMAAILRANPTVTETSVDSSKLLGKSESQVSDKAYQLNLGTNAISTFSTTQDVTVTIPIDTTKVPSDKLNGKYVYAKVYYPDNETSNLFPGTVIGSNLVLTLKGLPKNAVFSAVFNPSVGVILSSQVSGSSVSAFETPTVWNTNRWLVYFNYDDPVLIQVTADIKGVNSTMVTHAEIDDVINTRVAANAAKAGAVYKAGGFRQPNLTVIRDRAVSGTSEAVFPITLDSTGSGSRVILGNFEPRTLSFVPGVLYISTSRINSTAVNSLGTVYASVAHEMFHAVQSGYDVGYTFTSQGFMEGSAATYGYSLDKAAAIPQVRTDDPSEIHLLSNYLGVYNLSVSEAYSNQDFIAYVARVYNNNSLVFLKDFFEEVRKTLVTAAERTDPPLKKSLQALNAVFGTKLSTPGSLPDIYFDYVKQRAMEHSSSSRLRAGDPSTPMVLDTSLFHGSGAIFEHTVDPEDLRANPLKGSFSIEPFATYVVIVKPSKIADPAKVLLQSFSVSPTSKAKAMLYRKGEIQGAELVGGSGLVSNFGKSTTDILTVLVSNIDYEKTTFSYRLGPPVDTVEASVSIQGTNITFVPKIVVGSLGPAASSTATDNPFFLATEASELTNTGMQLNNTLQITTNPLQISSSEGTFLVASSEAVFKALAAAAEIYFRTPSIKRYGTSIPVDFHSTSGSIRFSRYSKTIGDRLMGTFSAVIAGTRPTLTTPATLETITGTISGSFDVGITASSSSSGK